MVTVSSRLCFAHDHIRPSGKTENILYPLLQQAGAPQEEEDFLLEEAAVEEEALPSWAEEEGEVEEALYG